jgi:hypothetical protein
MTGTNCDLFTHKQSRSYLYYLVIFFKNLTCDIEQLNCFPVCLAVNELYVIFLCHTVSLYFSSHKEAK